MRFPSRLGAASLAALLVAACGSGSSSSAVLPNDNTHPAGTLHNGVLTIALETRQGDWQPEGLGGRKLDSVAAFAEVGQPMSTPGPLLRVPVGTRITGTLHNTLSRALTIFGLGQSRGMADSMVVAPGATAPIDFVANAPGTYYYAARSRLDEFGFRLAEDSQLGGAIVVDGASPAPDRVFVISWYFTIDPKGPTGLGHGTMTINGLSWPHTERLTYAQGDSIHWRVVNLTEADHPMHLHGFYFRMEAHGTGTVDTLYPAADRRMAVTEIMQPFQTAQLSWFADRPGNWIYHCHYATHLSELVALDTEEGVMDSSQMAHHGSDRPHQMFGLVLGISIAPKGVQATAPPPDRIIRLVQREKPGVYGQQAGMAYVIDGTPAATDPNALPVPGPALILERGKRVQVNIVNQSAEHAAVHWHGVELESYPDGVPGWSGSSGNILPSINPGDSLTVAWTPPRAGSFMYHTHFSEARQTGSGLYGPIIVLPPGEKYDPETDRVLFFGTAGTGRNVLVGPFPNYMMNGSTAPPPMELKAGTRYRFRLFNLAGDFPTLVSLNQGAKPVMWRAVAKDGYPLPDNQATSRPAVLLFDPGEIYDFEFTPTRKGELTLSFGLPPFPPPPPPPPGAPAPPPPPPLPPTVAVPVHVR